jgi:HAD superfamily 5'-nucleotidase-like hydrolase
LEPLHGTGFDPRRAEEAQRRARKVLEDGELEKVMSTHRDRPVIDRARQVFVNRNLHMSGVELVGFDMDYTLAIYHLRRIEKISFEMTVARLVAHHGYPKEIQQLGYDDHFVIRGLFVDKRYGNLIKIDRFGTVGRAFHGRRQLTDQELTRLYRNERIRLKNTEYAWIDTLFALPEAYLFSEVIEVLEIKGGQQLDYEKLYNDIRTAIDTVHRDNSLKRELRADLGHYIYKDPELGPALHKLRSGGKKLFLLTNSLWDYTDAVMKYLLDGVVAEYPSWRNYFDIVVTGASKPDFFSGSAPFLEIDASAEGNTVIGEASTLERGKIYQGGNLTTFEKLSGSNGEKVLYVGDHIYGDILKSKKTSMWRTCMVVQEIEDEINYTLRRADEIGVLNAIELLRARLDDEIGTRRTSLNALERRLERETIEAAQKPALEEERKLLKGELDRLRKAYRECESVAATLETDIEQGFNKFWGLHFKEGTENSRFGEQVEQYACVYTSRVSNLLFYSPMQYFRSPRELMPHEQGGAPSGKLSPLGGEGLPKIADAAPEQVPKRGRAF